MEITLIAGDTQPVLNRQFRFDGIVDCTGVGYAKKKGRFDTICIIDVHDDYGCLVRSHVWLKVTPEIKRLHLCQGERVVFKADIVPYPERVNRSDFTLDNPIEMKRWTPNQKRKRQRRRQDEKKKGITYAVVRVRRNNE